MRNALTLGGLVYATLALFLGVMTFITGGSNAYSAHMSLIDSMMLGLSWPWHFLEYLGFVG